MSVATNFLQDIPEIDNPDTIPGLVGVQLAYDYRHVISFSWILKLVCRKTYMYIDCMYVYDRLCKGCTYSVYYEYLSAIVAV